MSAAPTPGISPDIQELIREVRDLQGRVLSLEQRLPQPVRQPTTAAPYAEVRVPTNALPAIGRALLAVAGAYVLRALTDLGVFTPAVGVTAGLVYALLWLFAAARLPATATFAMLLSSLTSVAIMAPILWEAATRLHAISSWTSAAVLAGFALSGLALAWTRCLAILAGIASGSAALTAAVLLLATHDLFPYTITLLVIAAALEFETCCGRQTGSRWVAALLADLTVLLLSWIVTRPQGLPDGYVATAWWAALTTQCLLIAIYGLSAVAETLVRGRTFTLFATLQTAVAVLTGVAGAAWVTGNNATGMLALGIGALIAGGGCYVVSFVVVPPENRWNFRAWATFGLLLVVCGSFLPFSGSASWAFWCACAVVCSWIALAARKPTLTLHGAAYVVLGAVMSGAVGAAASRIFGDAGTAPWIVAVLVFTSAMLSWVAIDRSPAGETARWRKHVSSFLAAATVVWILAGAAAHVLVRLWPVATGVPADTLATVVLTVSAVALAWFGIRTERKELAWVVYALMTLAAWKLATRDFPHERNLSLVISLLFYGGALMILPRIVQKRPAPAA